MAKEMYKPSNAELKMLRDFISQNEMNRVLQGIMASLLMGDSKGKQLIVDDSMQSRTDGTRIWVTLIPELFQEKWRPYWKQFLVAALGHEVGHCNSSNFADMEEIGKWYGDELEKEKFPRAIGENIAKDFLNAVEDGRIERIEANRRRGLVVPFRFKNEVIREINSIEKRAESPEEEFADFVGNVISYSKSGLYAPGIEHYAGTKFESFFFAVRDYIDAGIASPTSKGCRLQVQNLLMDCMPYFAELLKNSEQLQEQLQQQGAGSPEYSGSSGAANSNGQAQGSSGNGNSNNDPDSQVRAQSPAGFGHFNADENAQDDGQQSSGGDENGTNYGFATAGGQTPDVGYTPEQLAEFEQNINQQIQVAQQEAAAENAPPEMDGLSSDEINKLIQSAYNAANNSFKEEWLKLPNTPLPAELELQAMKLRKDLLKLFSAQKEPRRNQKSGYLNVRDLWKTGVGQKDIFYRPGRKNPGSCAFYILIDNSGSMSDNVSRNVTKSYAARRAAAVIEEALKGIVPVKVSLFECSGGTRHISLKTFDTKSKVNACYSSLSAIQPGGYNADSVHIRVAAKELQKRTEAKKFLFVLSDGLPSAYAGREQGEEEVRHAVEDARKANIIVVPIMFGNEGFRQQYQKHFEHMYSKNLISCDPTEVVSKLPELIHRLIVRS